jgi:hypothetical protein
LFRTYIAAGEAAGKDAHKMIPWMDIHDNLEQFIAPEHLPDRFKIKDPSKLGMGEISELVGHWRERLDRGLRPLEFLRYKNKRGDIVPCSGPGISLDGLIQMKELDSEG